MTDATTISRTSVTTMTDGFCGNPFNHVPHDNCAGVFREEVKETIVEKYDPITTAQDGTPYVKIKIFVEHPNGDTDILTCDRASRQMVETKTQEYVPWHNMTRNWTPRIETVEFSFSPNPLDEENGVAFTLELKDKDGNPREGAWL